MAERIAELPQGRGGGSTAVKEEWLDGTAWRLIKGEDYERSTSAQRAALSAAGRARGLRLRSRVGREQDGTESLAIQFITPETPKDTAAAAAAPRPAKRAAPAAGNSK